MAPALTRGATGTLVEEVRKQGHGMEMPWAQCFGKTILLFVMFLYLVIAAALLMLVVAAGFEKSWKTGLLVSLILVFWGCVGGCGLHWTLIERRHWKREERRQRRTSDGGVEEGRVREEGAEGGRDSGLGPGTRELVEGGVRYESLYPQIGDDATGSIQEAPGGGERVPLLGAAGARAGILTSAS